MLSARIVGPIDITIWTWTNHARTNSSRLKINRLCRVTVARDSSDYTRTIHGPLANRSPTVNNWMHGALHLPLSLGLLHLSLSLCLLHLVTLRISSILCWRDEHSSPNRLRWRNIHTHVLRKRIRTYGYQINPPLIHYICILEITCINFERLIVRNTTAPLHVTNEIAASIMSYVTKMMAVGTQIM